ncbi:uncharacterized protein ELE39_003740 [Cryptosporidium sp. chipmunk genotype I]|uniref:uncharacterized protein n=1 Tax=Cryptosporidium sp. chipmunk genotype I TaxID=1280935 RepID=UPI00351A8CF7|nr:hypothetical protein ELE39_003740 [Cryptosporidium sp. chipmunk genotype I]
MVDNTNNEFHDFDQYTSAIAHHTQKTVSRIIKEWYLYTLKRKILLELESYVGNGRRRKTKLKVLRDWFELSMRQRLNTVKEEYILRKKNEQILKTCLSYWYKEHYLIKRNDFKIHSYLKKMHSTHLIKEVFQLWYFQLINNKKYQKFQKNTIQKKAFFGWYNEYIKTLMIRNYIEINKKRRLILGYLQYIRWKKKNKEINKEKSNSIKKIILSKFFNNWVILVQYYMNKRYTILEWQINLVNNKMLQILKAWKIVILKKKQEKYKYNLLKTKNENYTQLIVFNLWYILAQESYRDKTMLIISGLSARRQLLMNGFFSLKKYIIHRRKSKILKEKSALFLINYVLMVFKRNGSSYAKHKIKLQYAHQILETRKIKIYWEKLIQYVNSVRIIKSKFQIINLNYKKSILQKTYKIWNYVWFKTVTNQMIVNCIQVKIAINIKRKILHLMIYIFNIRKLQFWKIFHSLIIKKLTQGFEKLRINMLYSKSQENIENHLGDQILQSIIIKHWRILTFENQKIHHFLSIIMLYRFLLFMKNYSKVKKKENEIYSKIKINMEIRVFEIWKLLSKKKKNLNIILKNTSIQEIYKKIIISSYFKSWYINYYKKRKLFDFINKKENLSKKLIFYYWKLYYIKKSITRNHYEKLSKKSNIIILTQFFAIWINKYKKNNEIRSKLDEFIKIHQKRRILITLVKMKQITIERKIKRQVLSHLFEKLEKFIISKVWIKIKEIYLISKSLHKISDKYFNHIQNKRLKLIYNHWRFVSYKIIKIRNQQKLSQEYYRKILIHRIFQIWRKSFKDEIIQKTIIIENIEHFKKVNFVNKLKIIIHLWRLRVFKNKEYKEKESIIQLKMKKSTFTMMIKLYNRINYYKKRILDSIHYEFINSFVFKLQYNRVIEMNQQISITLNISIEMYIDYSRLKRGMELWLKTMVFRIEQRRILQREMNIMEIKMNYFRLRNSFQKLYQWKLYIDEKYYEIHNNINIKICRNVIIELKNFTKETRFTIQVSDLLYRNIIMRKILDALVYWRLESKYQKECRNKKKLLEDYINKKLLYNIFIGWRRESEDYINYFKLIKSIEFPIKKRVIVILKCNYISSKILGNNLRIIIQAWNYLTNKTRLLKEKSEHFLNHYILKRWMERLFKEWRIKYFQKLNIYEFYDKVIIKRPIERVLSYWYNITKDRLNKEKELARKILDREKTFCLKSMIMIYKMNRLNCGISWGIVKRVFKIWYKLIIIEKFKKIKILKKCMGFWRDYSERKIIYKNRINFLIHKTSKRLIEDYFSRLILLYRKRINIKKKGEFIRFNRIYRNKTRIIEIWKLRLRERIKKKNDYQYLLIIHNNCILKMTIRIWKERMLREEKFRLIIYDQEIKRLFKIKSQIFNYWKSIWRPHHYIKVSKEFIKIFNRIILHDSFHKLLRVSFYSYTYNKENGNFTSIISKNSNSIGKDNFQVEIEKRVGYSYYMECKCSKNELIRGLLLLNVNNKLWIMNILSKVEHLRNNTIYEMLIRMREYVRIRKNYENGIKEFENNLRRMILSKVWIQMFENTTRIWMIRRLINRLRKRKEERIKRELLVRWVNKYNESIRNKFIIEYMRIRYGNTIKIKCYLIWSIKFEILKKKKVLKERYERYIRDYVLEYTIRRMNEYYLYNKWVIWCKKAYDRIEWVHDFRLKSLLFINWRRYSIKQKFLRDGLYLLYNRVKRRKIGDIMIGWLNRIRVLLIMRKEAENYYLNIIINRRIFKECFNVWRGLALRLRYQKMRILEYLENKSRNLKITCFKLWRFFIYYRKTRNSRFEKITNIIKLNHLNMMVYRIFYSWKLKTIESRSLKNSIFSFWNSGMGWDSGGREIEGAGGRGTEGKRTSELISPSTFNSPSQYSLEFSVSSLSSKSGEEYKGEKKEEQKDEDKGKKKEDEGDEKKKKDFGFMSIFSSSGNSSSEEASPKLALTHQDDWSVFYEKESQEQPKYENSSLSARGYVNKLLSSSLSSLSVVSYASASALTPASTLAPATALAPASTLVSAPVPVTESPYTESRYSSSKTRRSPTSYARTAAASSPFPQYSVVSSSSSSSTDSPSYSDGDLEIDELHSANTVKINKRAHQGQTLLNWNSPPPSPSPPSLPQKPPLPPQYSSYKSPDSINNDSIIRNRSNLSSKLPLPFPIPSQQPQIQLNQDLKQPYNSNSTPSSSSSFPHFSGSKKINDDPNLLMKLDTDTNQTIKDLPQDPYHISSSSPILKTTKANLNSNPNLKNQLKSTHSRNNIFSSPSSSPSSPSQSSYHHHS